MPKIRIPISLDDPQYFCNVSWTLSYNMNTKSWISFHSYIPNFYIAENNFFYSGINDCCEEFDFLVGTIVPNPPTTTTTSTSSSSTTTTTSTTIAPPNCNFNVTVTTLGCELQGIGYIVSYDCELYAIGYILPETTSTTSTSTSTTTSSSTTTTTTTSAGGSTTTTTTQTPSTTTTTTTILVINCGQNSSFSSGATYPTTQIVTLGSAIGTVGLIYNAGTAPDRFIVEWNSGVVIDSGYRGSSIYDFGESNRSDFTTSLIGKVDPITLNTYPDSVNYPDDGYPRILGSGFGSLSFNKNLASSTTATVKIYAPMSGTNWNYTLSCPTTTTTTTLPPTTTSTTSTSSTTTTTTTTQPPTTTSTSTSTSTSTTTSTSTSTSTSSSTTTTSTTSTPPTFCSITIYFDSSQSGTQGWDTNINACNGTGTPLIVYFAGPTCYTTFNDIFTNGLALFTNTSLTNPLAGNDKWYKDSASSGSGQVIQIGNDGFIDLISSCVTTTTTSTTQAPTSSSTTTTTTTATPSTTTTTTTVACSCTYYDVIITQGDLDDATGNTDPGKNDGTLYVDYTICGGGLTTKQYSLANTFLNDICVNSTSSPTIYYYKNNVQTSPMSGSAVSGTFTNCCP